MNTHAIILLLALTTAQPPTPIDPPLPDGAVARLGSPQWRELSDGSYRPGFTLNGRTVVLPNSNSIKAVDFDTGAVRWELSDFRGDANSAFLPDGRMVICDAGTIRIHDLATGKEIRRLKSAFQPYMYVASNGDLVAMQVGGWGPQPYSTVVVDLVTDAKPWHYGGMNDSAGICSPIGFVSGSRNLVLRAYHDSATWICVVDPDAQKLVREWKLPAMARAGQINPVRLSHDGKWLWTGGDKTVRLWDVATGKEHAAWTGHGDEVIQVAFSSDGKRLITSNKDRTLRWWDLGNGKEIGKIEHEKSIQALALSPDGKRAVAICGGENTLRRFDLAAGHQLPLPDGHYGRIEQLAFLPDSKTLLTASLDGTVRVWDIVTRQTVRTWKPNHLSLNWLAVSPDGKLAATAGYNDPVVRLWDVACGTELRSVTHPSRAVSCIAFSPDGQTLFSGGNDQPKTLVPIRLWNVSTGKETGRMAAQVPGPGGFSFTGDGKRFVTIMNSYVGSVYGGERRDAAAHLWDLATGKALRLDDTINNAGVLSPDDRSVAIVRQNRGSIELVLIEVASGQQRLKFDFASGISRNLAFSPDGRLLVTPGPSVNHRDVAGVMVWDAGTGKSLYHLNAEHIRYFGHFAFSPDGKTLATGGTDGTVLLWDATRFKPDAAVPIADGDALWSDLAADAPTAYQAVVALSRLGNRGVELLRPRLRAAEPIDPKRIAQLLTDLESPQFATRQKAASELAGYQDRVAKALEDRLKVTASAEARRQIQLLLDKVDGFLTISDQLREVRAVEVLARIGTPAAHRVLADLANGAPDARLTRESRAALTVKR